MGLKDAPDYVCDQNLAKLVTTIKNYVTSDVVAMVQNGVQAMGCLILYFMKNNTVLTEVVDSNHPTFKARMRAAKMLEMCS